ncbi:MULTISPECIES: cytochrome c1 [Rubrivivax]|uniref:Cytochrome c1 n=1 Tax=Rubrivivax benzoatilyticus TaxID=316997 RepID=A0ABX0HTW9_9BURK|nr:MULTISPECIES: cytochrome c1 [Rubrivivax]MCD0418804.1 cytochrome c1 [Rubrivivax sp. JA1024]EGJ10052.1 cytochrome c1 [Rubrivivax benzoatilyticus JA2 = ATCC BAA-35]MCC9598790.1 cytochrome c1 [Rubrivivax sp. JA1055]MCC9648490.1 cytochrome c1 [Rubrivivax sp. JA1029]NHK97212.1 cytochrome c1 [Rubrivivax benzoatilyticus]
MKKLILSLLASLAFVGAAHASSAGPAWDKFPTERLNDQAALQRGAQTFANYCLNCHSASYMRYNRMLEIGLTEQQIRENLIFTGVKVGDLMTASIDPRDAKEWFGATPPDLTLVARSRADGSKGSGADYLYTYLRGFYRDDSRPTGWNNIVFPAVGMPHALWEMQGTQHAVFEEHKDPQDPTKVTHVFKGFEIETPGTMSKAEYDATVADLVAFMTWMAEPMRSTRTQLGIGVLIFLAIFTVIAWRLNAVYWKDVK